MDEEEGERTDEFLAEDPVLRQIADGICTYASLDEIRMLLSEGVDVNEPLKHGRRLLQYAVYHRHVDAMKLLLVRGANPSLMDEKGYTPMHDAAQIGFCNVIRILLSYNARVNFTKLLPEDIGYCYPPRASPAEEPLRLALKNGYLKAAELLLKNGANPNAEYYSGFEINFIDPTDIKAIELLLQHGANPNARDRQGITLLMKACRNPGGLECATLLIEYGADVNAITDEEQRTPLHCAVLSGNTEIVQLLVANGARVKLPPYYTKPPPFFFALLKSDFSMMKYLIELGTDINQGSAVVGSCLHVALTELGESKAAVVRFLLENGADPNAILTLNGRTVLKPPMGEYLVSVTNHNINIVRMLLRYGARVVLMGQRQHPLGILLGIHHIDSRSNDELLELLASAAEAFSISLIDNSVLLSKRHKLVLLQRALTPLSLKHCARICVRNYLGFGPKLIQSVDALYLPTVLKRYLLYED